MNRLDKSPEDFGVRKVQTFKVDSFHFPKAGKMAGTSDGKAIWFQVYEKSHPFSPEEEDILHLDSSLWEIDYELDNFIYRTNADKYTDDDIRKLESSLYEMFTRHFDRIFHPKGKDSSLLKKVNAHIDAKFPADSTMPDSFRQRQLFKFREEDEVIKYYQKAAEIYQNAKFKSQEGASINEESHIKT